MTTTASTPDASLPTLALTPDRHLIRHTGHSTRYVAVRVVAPPTTRGAAHVPVSVAFCLDRSGSMGGRKIALAKQAVHEALARLAPSDRFTIVTFDDHAELVTPAAPATADALALARTRLHGVDARGSTALCEGWLTACGEIAQGAAPAQVTRCFLLTDGQANIGETRPEVLAQHARELLLRGVRTSAFGLGEGFNEVLLSDLTAAGGGQFYFIEQASQIADAFTSELGEAQEVTARDVRLTLQAPGVRCEPLTTYAVEPAADGGAVVRLGDLGSNQVIDLVVKLTFPDGAVGATLALVAALTQEGVPGAQASARFTFADHRDNDRQPRTPDVDRQVAQTYAAHARITALAKNRVGDFAGAERDLRKTAEKIHAYAGSDPAMLALARGLLDESRHYSTPMQELERKRAYATATSHLKGRDATGRARKA